MAEAPKIELFVKVTATITKMCSMCGSFTCCLVGWLVSSQKNHLLQCFVLQFNCIHFLIPYRVFKT